MNYISKSKCFLLISGTLDEVKLLLKEPDVRVDCLDEVRQN